MTKSDIIKEVVKIILKHAKPERIYLYGSQASGESSKTSDIDIAYDDPAFKEYHLIEEDVDALKTLLKIDVKNLAFTEKRFQNRVKTTGKAIYSASKKLRAQDGFYNFKKAFDRFSDAVEKKEELYREGYSDIYLDLISKRFEFTYEMSWKAIKRYLSYIGIESQNPRSCFKEAFTQGLIETESVWLDMLEKRNLSSHVYDEDEIKEILDVVKTYKTAFEKLLAELKSKLPESDI